VVGTVGGLLGGWQAVNYLNKIKNKLFNILFLIFFNFLIFF
jgi:hypothetical protein